MIIRAALLTYRDGCREDRLKDQQSMELVCLGGVIPERIEVFPNKAYYLLRDRDRLSHPDLCKDYGAVYLLDFHADAGQHPRYKTPEFA